MADQRPLEAFRLTLMQEVLPVGLAMVERVRKGGASKMVEGFTGSSDPLADLRDEGETAAKQVRERLDQVSPGLGNPVIQVDVDVEPGSTSTLSESPESAAEIGATMDGTTTTSDDRESLQVVLARIETRLDQLQQHLES